MDKTIYRKNILTIQKSFFVGLCSLLFFSSFMEQLSFAEVCQDKTIIEKTSKFFSPLLDFTGQNTYQQETIATVNGNAILLKDLLALYSAGTFDTNLSLAQSVDALRNDLFLVLDELITHELLRQELELHHVLVTDMDIQRAEREARAPFAVHDELERAKRRQNLPNFSGTDAEKILLINDIESIDTFAESLLSRGLSLTQWRTMLARQVRKDAFVKQVLDPTIHITPDAIEAASRAYPELMCQEKRVQCRLFRASSPEILEQIAQAFSKNNDAHLVDISGYTAEDFLIPYDRLPEAWGKVANRAESFFESEPESQQYAETIKENGETKILLVQAVLPARTHSLGEAYIRLEHVLMEQERALAFARWREQAWKKVDIRLIPQLSLQNRYDNTKKISEQ